MRFAISGSTGLIGSELTRRLRGDGHEVTRIVRSLRRLPHHERVAVWHPDRGVVEAAALEAHDVVIHLAGENIAGLWTRGKKQRIRTTRVRGTDFLARTLAALETPPRVLLSASAFGFYGDRPGESLDEDSHAGHGFLPDVARAWEHATQPAADAGIRVVHMRFGNVLSRQGGMLAAFLPAFRVGLGARFGSGTQFWPWIAIHDVTPAVLHVLDHTGIDGPVNFVAPGQVTNEQFTDALAAAVGRPRFLAVPAVAARLAPGGMADELLLNTARVVPRKFLDSGYRFLYPELGPALDAVLAR